jgi:hypothetical protein
VGNSEQGGGAGTEPLTPDGLDLAGIEEVFLLYPCCCIEAEDIIDEICQYACSVGSSSEVCARVVAVVQKAIDGIERVIPIHHKLTCAAEDSDGQLEFIEVIDFPQIVTNADRPVAIRESQSLGGRGGASHIGGTEKLQSQMRGCRVMDFLETPHSDTSAEANGRQVIVRERGNPI